MVRKRSRAHAAATSTRPFWVILPTPSSVSHPTEGRITEGASRAARGFIGGFAPNRRRVGLHGGRVCVEEASRALPVQMGGRSHGRRTKGSIIGVTGYLPVQARTLGH